MSRQTLPLEIIKKDADNPERRERVRLPEIGQVVLTNADNTSNIAARIFNRSDTGIYFETDTQFMAGSEVFIKALADDADRTIYRARIAWCRELPKDSNFYYGCGARIV